MATNPGGASYANPDNQSQRGVDQFTGLAGEPEYSTSKPSDFPIPAIPGPQLQDSETGIRRSLTDAEQAAGEIGTPNLPSSKVVTLSGGGQPGSIFAATIDGKQFFEQISDPTVRTLSGAAAAIAQTLEASFPYLRVDTSGAALTISSMNPTLTITAPSNPIPLPIPTVYQGNKLPRPNDSCRILINNFSITTVFNGQEIQADMVLQKIYMSIFNSGAMRNLFRMESYFVNSYSSSYLYLAPFNGYFTKLQVYNKGQIQLRLGPMNAGAGNYTYTVV
jgi:hypothetical protein